MDKFTAAAGNAQKILFETFVDPRTIAAYNMVKPADEQELASYEGDFLRLFVAGEIAAAAISSACLLIENKPANGNGAVSKDSINQSIAKFSSVPNLDKLQLEYESDPFHNDAWGAIDFFQLKDNQAGDVGIMFGLLRPIFQRLWKVETGKDADDTGMFWLAGISAFHQLVEAESRRRIESNSTVLWTLNNQNLVGSSELLPMLCAALSAIAQVHIGDPSPTSTFWPLTREEETTAKARRPFRPTVRGAIIRGD